MKSIDVPVIVDINDPFKEFKKLQRVKLINEWKKIFITPLPTFYYWKENMFIRKRNKMIFILSLQYSNLSADNTAWIDVKYGNKKIYRLYHLDMTPLYTTAVADLWMLKNLSDERHSVVEDRLLKVFLIYYLSNNCDVDQQKEAYEFYKKHRSIFLESIRKRGNK
jgi:hypothetical protein